MKVIAVAALLALAAPLPGWAASSSVFLTKPDDPSAITVSAKGDGKADDTAAIQGAIDAAAAHKTGGVVFLPSGRYRITRTVFVRPAVRIFGVGPTRPVFVLADNTPGFQKGVANMLLFNGGDQYGVGRPANPPPTSRPFDPTIFDATSNTFYSALSNVDFEIGRGNPAAAAVRFRVAQHGFLSHIDFHLGSGFAGIYQAGNEAEDLHFFGGRYGIVTEKTSPAWQFTLIDSSFEGQRAAAIREHEVDLTLVNTTIRSTPVGIDIDQGYSDSLWGEHLRFENVAKAGVIVSNEDSVFTQVGFQDVVATRTPTFVKFRDSGRTVAPPGRAYRVRSYTWGLTLLSLGEMGEINQSIDADTLPAPPAPRPRAIRALPPVAEWTNVKTLGAKGDGATDDTKALQAAIDAHRVVYLPMGVYQVSDTLHLKPDTVLIGLHPSLTQVVLPENAPAYAGVGSPKALIESAKGGDAIVSGLGLYTGGVNPRATALLWKAGETSLVDDVRIHGGRRLDQSDPQGRWDGQYPSIWVTDGGGGVFADIWTPDTFAQAGFYVTDTSTPGHVYELSNEHHVRNEIVLDGVKHWEFLAPQTEEEVRESQDAVSLEVRHSSDILFANYHAYRVTRTIKPAPTAVRLFDSGDLHFRNVTTNAESAFATCDANGCATYVRASKFPFENALEDVTHKLEVREREFAVLDVPSDPRPPPPSSLLGVEVKKLEDGFYSIAGAAVDAKGKLYFIDRRNQRILGWSAGEGLSVVRDNALDPVNLAIDASGELMVLSSDGPEATVYAFRPGMPDGEITVIKPTPATAHPDAATALPVNLWDNGEFKDQLDPDTYRFTTLAEMFARDVGRPKAREYVSPDGSLVLPAFRVFQQGPANFAGWRFSDTLDAYGFVAARPGERVFVVNGSEGKTYSGRVGQGGALTDLKAFADRGGEGVAVDAAGNVYVANGQIFVYDPAGRPLGRIDTPERPLQLVFGGPDRRTLFILTHHSLYAARLPDRLHPAS
jgi:sugar lactone lactonase YvrE